MFDEFTTHMGDPGTWKVALTQSKELLDALVYSVRDGVTPPTHYLDRSYTPVQIICIYAAGCFVLNWGLRAVLIGPVARLLLHRGDRSAKPASVVKFSQSAMEGFFYGGSTILGCLVFLHQPFCWPSTSWWEAKYRFDGLSSDLICFYLLYAGRYLQSFVSVMLEFRRKDFWEMQIHHMATIALILLSYYHSFIPIGTAVMVLLDPADVPLHTAKLFKYVADTAPSTQSPKSTVNRFFSNRLFEVFAVTFFITRIVMYPYSIYSCSIEATASPSGLGTEGWYCVVFLSIIYVLQWYWMILIVKVALKQAKTGDVEDNRSDSEDEDDAPKPKKD
ncbi:LAG1 longevity assurance-like protein 2 [Diplonema papillatum]|nr:LAG1 longevity assurance-like protein 2 [Diplonema papillatum]